MKMSQRPVLLCVGLVTFSSLGWSMTYYVDAANGNDSNAGTSASAPWQTIAKVNGSSFSPGDSVLLMRGDVWREQLNIPSSGSAGKVITFDAYGTGANPQINAADIVSSWINVSGNLWSAAVGWIPHEAARNKTRAQNVASQSALVQNYQWYYDGSDTLYVYSSTNPNTDGSLWEVAHRSHTLRFDACSHLVIQNMDFWYSNINAGSLFANVTTPQTDITFNNINVYYAWSYGITTYNVSGTTSYLAFNNVTVDHCCIQTGGIAGLWINSVAYGTNAASHITITGGEYKYSGVDPAITTTEAFGICLDHCTACTVSNVTIDHNGSSGLNIQNASSGVTVTGGSFHDDGQAASGDRNEIGIGGLGAGSSNITLSGVDLYNNPSPKAIVEICPTDNNNPMSNVTVQYCQLHGSAGHGFQIDGGGTGITLAYNIVYNNGGYGYVDNSGSTGNPQVLLYNNVFWANGSSSNPGNLEISANGGTTAKNNIIGQANGASAGTGYEVRALAGSWLTASDYNDWYHSGGGNFMSYQGKAYSLAGWRSATGQDAHSLSIDPQFVSSSPSGPNDFKLRPTSPVIGAGANLGTAYENGLDSQSPDFPYATLNENLSGPGWDIGAFVFRQSFLLVVK
jgi:hypothetical protein